MSNIRGDAAPPSPPGSYAPVVVSTLWEVIHANLEGVVFVKSTRTWCREGGVGGV